MHGSHEISLDLRQRWPGQRERQRFEAANQTKDQRCFLPDLTEFPRCSSAESIMYYPHFKEEESCPEKVSDLVKVTQQQAVKVVFEPISL